MKKRLERENRNKYGSKSTDIIATNYKHYGAGFMVGNLDKLSMRIINVSKMKQFNRLLYRYILRKGGRADGIKIVDFLDRLMELNEFEYWKWLKIVNNRLYEVE